MRFFLCALGEGNSPLRLHRSLRYNLACGLATTILCTHICLFGFQAYKESILRFLLIRTSITACAMKEDRANFGCSFSQ